MDVCFSKAVAVLDLCITTRWRELLCVLFLLENRKCTCSGVSEGKFCSSKTTGEVRKIGWTLGYNQYHPEILLGCISNSILQFAC